MIRKLVAFAAALALPAIVAAQTPQIPNEHASDTAKAKVALHTATHFRGAVVTPSAGEPSWSATPAKPSQGATPATTEPGVGVVTPAVPASPAAPAVPAVPPGRPASPGKSGSHRP
jgi:hypothetical protein